MNKVKTPKLKLWYNPYNEWYEVFTPDGKRIENAMKVCIKENFPEKGVVATIEFAVEIVNEPPI